MDVWGEARLGLMLDPNVCPSWAFNRAACLFPKYSYVFMITLSMTQTFNLFVSSDIDSSAALPLATIWNAGSIRRLISILQSALPFVVGSDVQSVLGLSGETFQGVYLHFLKIKEAMNKG